MKKGNSPKPIGRAAEKSIMKYTLTINTHEKQHKGLWRKTHYTDSQNCDTTAPSGRELYHLQFSRQAASPDTFGYTIVHCVAIKFPE
jgi:hypothetical protein